MISFDQITLRVTPKEIVRLPDHSYDHDVKSYLLFNGAGFLFAYLMLFCLEVAVQALDDVMDYFRNEGLYLLLH